MLVPAVVLAVVLAIVLAVVLAVVLTVELLDVAASVKANITLLCEAQSGQLFTLYKGQLIFAWFSMLKRTANMLDS